MRARGFSLLEVMIAVTILGLVLTVILSAQGGLAASNKAAANLGQAITAARCKMTEQEERLLKMGYPEIDQVDTDVPCCEDVDGNGVTCDVRVEKIELPKAQDAAGDAGIGAGLNLGGTDGGILGGALGSLNAGAGGAGLDLSGDGGLAAFGSTVQTQLLGGAGGAAAGLGGASSALGGAGAAEGLLNMVMSMAYPSVKPLMEASIRRITVVARWKEGPNARSFQIVQYVTNPQRGGFMDLNGVDGGGLPIPGLPGGAAGLPGIAGGAAGLPGGATTSGGTTAGGVK